MPIGQREVSEEPMIRADLDSLHIANRSVLFGTGDVFIRVQYTVVVVVNFRTAVFILVTIEILCKEGTFILVVSKSVAIMIIAEGMIRAAIKITVTVDRLRLVRTAIREVQDVVLIVVGVMAAVTVLETIQVFFFERAFILKIKDAVLIIVWFWTSVTVPIPVDVLLLIRALIRFIEDPVPILIPRSIFPRGIELQ